MERFIPYEKLSKKERQKLNAARRGSWNGLDPVTRRPENAKAYNRRKARKWSDDSMTVPFAISFLFTHRPAALRGPCGRPRPERGSALPCP